MGRDEPDVMGQLMASAEGLSRRFTEGNNPFQIMTRLFEECGELAAEVNHAEGLGVKREKLGEPDRGRMAHEVRQVLQCAVQVAQHYQLEGELTEAIGWSFGRLRSEGFIE